jgi:NAD(P)-dependent dehydrogenase (short-subunit alcohol dehydrogenase family)
MYLKRVNFKRKFALVTGAGKGLGRACSIALAEGGAHVIAISRTQSDLDKLEQDIRKIKGKITKIVCDVTDYQDLTKKINKVNKIDILINNAGTNIPELFKEVKQQSLNYLINLNLKAAFNVAQLIVRKMLKNKVKDGAIVHMSSQLGHVSMEGRSVYSMTKFGVEGLTKGMSLELAKSNIRVNAVCPTYVETPLVKKVFKNKKLKKLVLSRIPMGKTATESDIATAVCFLASSAASMITGTSLLVDGGWTAQ